MKTRKGRLLPLNDWEGDDRTPGAGGAYVTCMDTAVGRMVAWATNGRVTKDGRAYRAAVRPRDTNGINYTQAAQAVHDLTGRTLHTDAKTKAEVKAWLKDGKGLVIIGRYSTIPRAYRHQAKAAFDHAMFVTHMSADGSRVRLYDPLDPNTRLRGRSVPSSILWPFMDTLGYQTAYVHLEAL